MAKRKLLNSFHLNVDGGEGEGTNKVDVFLYKVFRFLNIRSRM